MFYPLFLELKGRRVVVVGGGAVAERKVETLLEAEADVLVVAPEFTSRLRSLQSSGALKVRARRFEEQDLDQAFLVISATDDPAAQEQIAAAARSRNVPVNTADMPRLCDFILPAVVRKGDITVAISTGGKSPALAAELRARLDSAVTDNAARAVRLLGEIRAEVHAWIPNAERRKQAFEAVVNSGLLEWIGECDDATALQRIRKTIEGFL